MPEPTDHRAEAEDWLKHATTVTSHDEAVLEALIGIGHALLALQDTVRTLRSPRASYPPLSPSEG